MAHQETDSAAVGEPSDLWRSYRGAPTGTAIECEGWRQEAALRLLNNNLDRNDRGAIRDGAVADLVTTGNLEARVDAALGAPLV